MPDQEGSVTPNDAHRMRITTAGSIPNYVRFAVDFLLVRQFQDETRQSSIQDNPHRPLILHTLPPSTEPIKGQPKKTSLHSCTTNVPRLISVVEQIKREILAPRGSVKGKEKGKRNVRGIWQYNQSGSLPLDSDNGEGGEDPLMRVLSGKTK